MDWCVCWLTIITCVRPGTIVNLIQSSWFTVGAFTGERRCRKGNEKNKSHLRTLILQSLPFITKESLITRPILYLSCGSNLNRPRHADSQDNLLTFKPTIGTWKKDDLRDLSAGLIISETADLLGFSHITISWAYRESTEKKKIFTEWQLSGSKCLVDVRYQRGKAQLLQPDRKASVTKTAWKHGSILPCVSSSGCW